MSGRAELAFFPGPGLGHFLSAVEMAKLLVNRDEGLSVIVFLMKLVDVSELHAIEDSVSASSSNQRIRFIELPQAESRSASPGLSDILNALEFHKHGVREVVRGLVEGSSGSDAPQLAGFVLDMFCISMMDLANEFGVPSYLFYTSSATFLRAMLHLQILQDDYEQDIAALIDSEASIDVPGLAKPLNIKSFMPSELRIKEVSSLFLGFVKKYRETKGILVNTFKELETAVESTLDDKLPPLYAVGPILNLKTSIADSSVSKDIVKWLDDQPPQSVVFLCFGSMGSLTENQAKEVTRALEKTGHRFLWALRLAPPEGKVAVPERYKNPADVLTDGFIDRTQGRGKVIGWAPQAEVLAHPAVSIFVSHCGWNSTLESIWFGVPVAAWPMYAEQHLNAFALVKEHNMAVEISMNYRREFAMANNDIIVTAEEIERGIRHLMEAGGKSTREKAKSMCEKSRTAVLEGGSSHTNIGRFIKDVYANVP